MPHNAPHSVALPVPPATKVRASFTSKTRSAFVAALAALAGTMAFADVASAHYLTRDLAEASARGFAQRVVNDPRTPYIFDTAVCDDDSQAVPHIRGCTLMYDTPQTRPTTRWACTERVQIFYQPHNAGDPPPNYNRFIRRGFTHPC